MGKDFFSNFFGLKPKKTVSDEPVFPKPTQAEVKKPEPITPVIPAEKPAPFIKPVTAPLQKVAVPVAPPAPEVKKRFIVRPKVVQTEPVKRPEVFENPLDKLKRLVHYESASFDEQAGVLKVGSNIYTRCEKLDVGGIQSTKYRAIDSQGQPVMVKIRNNFGAQDIDTIEPYTESDWGESEQLVLLKIDEAVLALMADCETGKGARPKLLAVGKLADGKSLFVEEMIQGEDPIGCIYPLRYNIEQKPEESQKDWENRVNCIKAVLLSMFHDASETVNAMIETGVFSKDIKMADYIIQDEQFEHFESPQKVEQNWHGVFVDWGVGVVRVDKVTRPMGEEKDLFVEEMKQLLGNTSKGVYSCFFLQSPQFPTLESASRIKDEIRRNKTIELIHLMNDVRKPLEALSELLNLESNNPQPDFNQKALKSYVELNLAAEKLGLKMRFRFPF